MWLGSRRCQAGTWLLVTDVKGVASGLDNHLGTVVRVWLDRRAFGRAIKKIRIDARIELRGVARETATDPANQANNPT
jgi:hypothetical protein